MLSLHPVTWVKMDFRPSHFFLRVFLLSALGFAISAAAQPPTKLGSSSKAPARRAAAPDSGSIQADGAYRNPFFGFSYKVPFGWVDRTESMQEGSEPGESAVLLAAFERPPEAPGDSINSAVVIAAERASSYPGLKSAADYFDPLTELATSKGFKVENEAYQFAMGTRQLVRGDFSKQTGSLTMRQSSLVMLEKGYAVSFTFIAGSEDEASELIEKLSFKPEPQHPAGTRK